MRAGREANTADARAPGTPLPLLTQSSCPRRSPLGYGRTEASAASAALSNSPSSHSFAPRRPETTSRAQATYSSLRFTDQSGDGLAVIALKLLVLSASLMILARSDFLDALSTCFH